MDRINETIKEIENKKYNFGETTSCEIDDYDYYLLKQLVGREKYYKSDFCFNGCPDRYSSLKSDFHELCSEENINKQDICRKCWFKALMPNLNIEELKGDR